MDDENELLTKGLEEEVYTGTADGHVVGLSHRIAADLPGFATEPDARNVEYRTEPTRSYRCLIRWLMGKRCRLRRYLDGLGSYTLIPGATLSLEQSDDFVIACEKNPYYRYIRDTYGTKVVTASTHINVGIEDSEELMRAYRVIRAEASLYLALTASSPFLKGKATGYHSMRWHTFPPTPPHVPFFADHAQFVAWEEKQLSAGTMQNPRHLWLSARPNGPDTPHELNRLELRICDRISDPFLVTAVTALLETRILQILETPELDPLARHNDRDLQAMATRNEAAAAKSSLDAELQDWSSGEVLTARRWIERLYDEVLPVAEAHGCASYLPPIRKRLEEGNLAMRWLERHRLGEAPQAIIASAIVELAALDLEFDPECMEEKPLAVGG